MQLPEDVEIVQFSSRQLLKNSTRLQRSYSLEVVYSVDLYFFLKKNECKMAELLGGYTGEYTSDEDEAGSNDGLLDKTVGIQTYGFSLIPIHNR